MYPKHFFARALWGMILLAGAGLLEAQPAMAQAVKVRIAGTDSALRCHQEIIVTSNASERLVAHEIGHSLGLPVGPGLSDYAGLGIRKYDLMAHFAYGYRIHKKQADIVN